MGKEAAEIPTGMGRVMGASRDGEKLTSGGGRFRSPCGQRAGASDAEIGLYYGTRPSAADHCPTSPEDKL